MTKAPTHTIIDIRPRLALALLAALATGAGALSIDASASPSARTARVAKLQLRQTSAGKLLVDSSGFTVYRFTKDTGRSNTCLKVSGCSGTWPALTTTGRPIAGSGVRSSLLSTITLPNGSKQVTYAGHPLYRYAAASERAETVYISAEQFGGKWYGVNASGSFVK